MDEEIIWNIIDKYFKENTHSLVEHHIESYNDFFKYDIFKIFKEKNPIRIQTNFDEKINDYKNQCVMYFGGKNGDKVYLGKPIIYDDNDNVHYMFPNEARLRDMTYGTTIHFDIEIDFIDILNNNEMPTISDVDDKVDILTENEDDYPKKKKFSNLKKDKEFLNKINEDEIIEGGGPKKKERTKHTKKEFQITTKMASEMKEKMKDSMIEPNIQKRTEIIKNVYLGKIPIMLQSNLCVLNNLTPDIKFSMGECKNDFGGYFIINGKEKTIVCQEKYADNLLNIKKFIKDNEPEDTVEFLYSAEIKSVSENVSKPKRTLSVRILAPSNSFTNKNIVVYIPNVKKPIPLFILFRALGVISDKAIIEMCLLDIDKYEHMLDLFAPSVHDAGGILTQKLAIEYISTFIKGQNIESVLEILSDYFLPHIGETNYTEKAYFLGYIVFRLLSVHTGLENQTDRDNFKCKRIELIGQLLYDLFSEYYNEQQAFVKMEYTKKLNFSKSIYSNDLLKLITDFQNDIFKNRIVDEGIRIAFKGNWGSKTHTKRIGILQDLNRLSANTYLSHLRKTNLPLPSGVKLVAPRLLHTSHWGFIDPIDTPDGGNIGLHKTLSIMCHVSRGKLTRDKMCMWLREKISMKLLNECSPLLLSKMTKVIVNGYWMGSIFDPFDCVNKIKLFKRNALIPIDTSVTFDIKLNSIFIYTDSGRLCRPIFYRDYNNSKISIEKSDIMKKIKSKEFSWSDLVTGFNTKKKNVDFNPFHSNIYELNELYTGVQDEINPNKIDRFLSQNAIIDYIDSSESENTLISLDYNEFHKKNYTHCEIHESLIFGNMCNLIIFPENNPPSRNAFSCGQSKQACSLYHSNFDVRMDKTAVILNNGQIPIIKTRFLEYINNEELPYGENAIVAIMCHGGYNMEDSILINESSLQRGLFNTTYYNTYESHEEIKKSNDFTTENKFANIENTANVNGKKLGFDYSHLDKNGIIKSGTIIDNDKIVVIGMISNTNGYIQDVSITPKKGQLGIVDKTFITDNEQGERIAKVKIRHVRIPNLGDKFASRAGQKGTVGLVIPQSDMPFTKNGLTPDIIINPHAIPSRMTIGQLLECLIGKACLIKGGFGDCTAFVNKGTKTGIFGEILTNFKYHSSGNEILYDGKLGKQIESEIFIGPTYYMRLKHMVKDKINYRARGPNTALTRQSVSGRANDGGLRIGEMERDAICAHGTVNFITESMMERADKYQMAICNNTGMISIVNPDKNLFLSPMCDGPIKFIGSIDGKDMNIENISKFGRSFSIVQVPYSLKLLIQELMAINVQLRIITEDNIEQIENMSFSNNIEKLSGLSSVNELCNTLKKQIRDNNFSDQYALDQDLESSLDDSNKEFEIKPIDYIDDPGDFLIQAKTPDESPPFEFPPTPSDISIASPDPNSPQYPNDSNIVYSPNSPLEPPPDDIFYPTTPDDSPPPMTGGSINTPINFDIKNYSLGDLVILNEDLTNPPVQWKITNVKPNFLTIKRVQESNNFADNIKIVKRDEIKHYSKEDIITKSNLADVNNELSQLNIPNKPDENPQNVVVVKPVFNVVGEGNKGDIVNNDNENNLNPDSSNNNDDNKDNDNNDGPPIIKFKEPNIDKGDFIVKKI